MNKETAEWQTLAEIEAERIIRGSWWMRFESEPEEAAIKIKVTWTGRNFRYLQDGEKEWFDLPKSERVFKQA